MTAITDSQWFARKERGVNGKTACQPVVVVRMTRELKDRLDAAADWYRLSMNRMCCGAIEAMVAEVEAKKLAAEQLEATP